MATKEEKAALLAKQASDEAGKIEAMWKTKESGAIPEEEKKIRGLHTAKEAAKNNLLKAWFATAGAAVAQAARAWRNRLRRGK